MKIYAFQHRNYMPWHLSRLSFIYGSFPVVPARVSDVEFHIEFEKLRSSLMPAPYDTGCYDYDQYKCIYDCSQLLANSTRCLRACAKPGCRTMHLSTLSHTTIGTNTSSRVVLNQNNMVKSTVFEAKTNLFFVVLNVLGLFGVFFGFSMLDVADTIWSLLATRWTVVKKILQSTCYVCAATQCLLIARDHLQYPHVTEVYQGGISVTLPKSSLSVCFDFQLTDKPWAETAKPRFTDEIEAVVITKYNGSEITFVRDESLADFERKYVSTYSLNGKFCYLLSTPVEDPDLMWVDKTWMKLDRLELALVLQSDSVMYEISAYAHSYDISHEDLRVTTPPDAALQTTYLKIVTLPQPYKTDCQKYGQSSLSDFESRTHCINTCALSRFKASHPGQHPINIPIFNGSDESYIAGDAQGYLDLCRHMNCRWRNCEEERFNFYAVRQRKHQTKTTIVESAMYFVFEFRDVPITNISDTLLILISTLGFWTGVSTLQLLRSTKKLMRLMNAKRWHRKALKKIRQTLLVLGLIVNLYTALEKFVAYESLSQAYSQPAARLSPMNLFFLQPSGLAHCPDTGCESADFDVLATQYSRRSHDLLGRVWSRDFERNVWLDRTF
ncbi:hypothetical protein HDE_03593 [Halotydeus destructor]|nr:hypothetical protein HDE_03593 [Halotydeus destructor]